MTYEDKTSAEVIADSIYEGVRLVTMRATFPRFILAEFNTHRAFSRNSASSRAIPTLRQIELIRESPFFPKAWPRNQRGMTSIEDIWADADIYNANVAWESALDAALRAAENLHWAGVHKQIASRLLEPFMWHAVIVSSTMPGLDNFFAQRDHEDAQPEMQTLARAMRKALDESTPDEVVFHIPFCGYSDDETEMIRSVARCARVSYGREMEEKLVSEDAALVERLIRAAHWSPFEHVGIVTNSMKAGDYYDPRNIKPELRHLGNFEYPWSQLRHHWQAYLPSIAAKITS